MEEKFRKQVEKMLGYKNLEKPPKPELGDLAFPCFELAKKRKRNPSEVAKEIANKLKPRGLVSEIRAVGPYVNFFLNMHKFSEEVLRTVLKEGKNYGKGTKRGRIIVEFCHVNTHKAFHIGHVRNTCLGEAISRLLEFQGYKVLRFNYQGDIGPHVARCLWGLERLKLKEPKSIHEKGRWLGLVYSMASKKISKNKKFEEEVKELTKQLYEGKSELMKLWKETRKWSLSYFDSIYRDLDVKFDKFFFESDFGKTSLLEVRKLLKKGLAKESDGAIIFDLKKYGLDVAVLVSKEGYPLYHAKDIALARKEFSYKPDRVIHVVASEQDFYFRQLFKILEFVKKEWSKKNYHLSYGLVNLKTGKMSSREGSLVTYDELIEKLRSHALKESKKATNLKRIAEIVAIGALKYDMLKMSENKNILFDWKDALDLQGNSAPYLQYTHARAKSILRKANFRPKVKGDELLLEKEKTLVKEISSFPKVVSDAAENGRPHTLANYLYKLCNEFNEYYQTIPVLKSKQKSSRLALVKAVSIVLKNGLKLLGIEAPEKM